MSPGLRYEDLARITAPYEGALAFLPRATKSTRVRVAGGTERIFVTGLTPEYARLMNRPIGSGRGLTEDDRRRRSSVAVVGATLGSKLFGGVDPVGRDVVVDGVPFRIVGMQAPVQIFNEELYLDANGLMVPLETYMDRMDPSHQLTHVAVKLRRKSGLADVSALVLGRAKQAHHGIEDVGIKDLEAESARAMPASWTRCAAGASSLEPLRDRAPRRRVGPLRDADLVRGPQVRDRLRKSLGASDGQILVSSCSGPGARRPRRLRRHRRGRPSAAPSPMFLGLVVNPRVGHGLGRRPVARARVRPLPGHPRLAPVAHGGHALAALQNP